MPKGFGRIQNLVYLNMFICVQGKEDAADSSRGNMGCLKG